MENQKQVIHGKRWTHYLVLLVILVCIVTVFAGCNRTQTPEEIAEKYMEAAWSSDFDKMAKYSAYDVYGYEIRDYDSEAAYFEEMSGWYGEEINSWASLSKVIHSSYDEEFTSMYGKYKISFECIGSKELELNNFTLHHTGGNKMNYCDWENITAVMEVTVQLTLTGESETVESTATVYLVQMGDSWKVINVDF